MLPDRMDSTACAPPSHLGPAPRSQLVQQTWSPGRANTGDKIMTLVASALAGGDCIDDPTNYAWSRRHPHFLRSFRWGHVANLSRELLAR